VASAGGRLFLHSAFPTSADDSVFFGPDTYRYLRLIEQRVTALGPVRRIVDMGAGSGAGGIHAAGLCPGARVTLVDINPAALRLARINAAAAEVEVEAVLGDRIAAAERAIDLVIANPPYMIDPDRRAYRDGGGLLGGEIALKWVEEALGRLDPGGAVLLYTGAPVVDGRMPLADALDKLCRDTGARISLEEIDPDVFGEELDGDAYRDVERIAAIGATITAA
jgi:methylase of polypeptide subunit release factors